MPTGLILSAVAVALLLFTGRKGGELVYRHRVGVVDTPDAARQETVPRAPRRAA